MTAPSPANSPASTSLWKKAAHRMSSAAAKEDRMPHSNAFRARSSRPAPIFWATKADMDCI